MCDVVYRIAKWGEVFENSQSRKLVKLTWVSMPVGFSSNGYQRMLDDFGDEAPAIYGAWCALVGFAAGCPTRGLIATSKGEPIKIAHVARQCGFPAPLLKKLVGWASRSDVRWLEVVPSTTEVAAPEQVAETVAESTTTVADQWRISGGISQAQGETGRDTTRPDTTRHNNTLSNDRSEEIKPRHLDNPQFADAWDRWGRHLLECGKPMTTTSSEAQLYKLMPFSVEEAIAIVEFSIDRNAKNLIINGDHKRIREGPSRGGGGSFKRKTPGLEGII